jgi:hypothetical protein
MNLGEVKAQFTSLMNRTDLKNKPDLVSTFINQAIVRIQRELRVPFMEKTILYTIPEGYTKLSVPSDLLELIDINVDDNADGILNYPLQRVQLREAAGYSQQPGTPRVFARKGGAWIVGPKPTVGSKIEIVYHAEFAPLIDDTSTNTLTKIAWDAVVYGALSAAGDYYNDDRTKTFEGRYNQIMQNLQNQADSDELTADAAVRPALPIGGDDW